MFLGEYNHTIDDKGRLTLPAKWRDELEEGVVVTRGLDLCLFVFTRAKFKEFADELERAGFTQADARQFSRFLMAKAMDDRPDKQGRIILPPGLREFGGLNGEALIIGSNNRIEVWNPKRYADLNAHLESNIQDVAERMGAILERVLFRTPPI